MYVCMICSALYICSYEKDILKIRETSIKTDSALFSISLLFNETLSHWALGDVAMILKV